MLKVLLTVGAYFLVVLVLGYVLAALASREAVGNDFDDDQS